MRGELLRYFVEAEKKILLEFFSRSGAVLSELLGQHVLQHVEPQRRGVPRGKAIGFPRKKVWAAFLAAIGYNPIEVYQLLILLRMSYGTIRHWFIEPEFKKMVLLFQGEITDRFVNRLVELSKTTDMIDTLADIKKNLGETGSYGSELRRKIFLAIIDQLNESKSLILLWLSHLVIRTFSNRDEEGKRLDKELDSYLKIHILGFAFHAIKNPKILLRFSPIERKQYSKMLERFAFEEGGQCAFLGFDDMERLFDNDSWTLGGLRFTGRVGLVSNGQPVGTKRRRPRKNVRPRNDESKQRVTRKRG